MALLVLHYSCVSPGNRRQAAVRHICPDREVDIISLMKHVSLSDRLLGNILTEHVSSSFI